MRQKRETIERKMAQAEEKRQHMLKSKAQKAHDEEAKVGGGCWFSWCISAHST